MKKKIIYVFIFMLFIPIMNVSAITCNESLIITKDDSNFSCSDVDSESITFSYNGKDYKEYFNVEGNRIEILDAKKLIASLDKSVKVAGIEIKDNNGTAIVKVENSNYVEPTTTTTTTKVDEKTFTVTLDHNNQTGQTSTKTCSVTSNNNTCSITLPKLEGANFSGWGTAKTCKDGSSGTIRVTENTTYYACYKNNQNQPAEKPVLNSIKLINEETKKELDIGTFSIKKTTYELIIENDVTNITVDATTDEGNEMEITGNSDLKDGENQIIIKLTNSSGEQNTYTINVTKLKKGQTIDKNHYLSSLSIGGVENLNFNKTSLVYNITIQNNIDKLIINYEPEKKENKVTITGNENLVDGSIIKVNVTGSDNETTTYTINVTKEKKDNSMILIIGGIAFFIILLLTTILFIKTSKKNKQNNTSQKTPKVKKTRNKSQNNGPQTLPESKEEIEILKF